MLWWCVFIVVVLLHYYCSTIFFFFLHHTTTRTTMSSGSAFGRASSEGAGHQKSRGSSYGPKGTAASRPNIVARNENSPRKVLGESHHTTSSWPKGSSSSDQPTMQTQNQNRSLEQSAKRYISCSSTGKTVCKR